jgi:hypothetical protein
LARTPYSFQQKESSLDDRHAVPQRRESGIERNGREVSKCVIIEVKVKRKSKQFHAGVSLERGMREGVRTDTNEYQIPEQ